MILLMFFCSLILLWKSKKKIMKNLKEMRYFSGNSNSGNINRKDHNLGLY